MTQTAKCRGMYSCMWIARLRNRHVHAQAHTTTGIRLSGSTPSHLSKVLQEESGEVRAFTPASAPPRCLAAYSVNCFLNKKEGPPTHLTSRTSRMRYPRNGLWSIGLLLIMTIYEINIQTIKSLTFYTSSNLKICPSVAPQNNKCLALSTTTSTAYLASSST